MSGENTNQKTADRLRKKAVLMRLHKKTLEQVRDVTGLSHPTIISAYKRFMEGGWDALVSKSSGRPVGAKGLKHYSAEDAFARLLSIASPAHILGSGPFWTPELVKTWLGSTLDEQLSIKSVQRYLQELGLIDSDKFEVVRSEVLKQARLSKTPTIYVSGLRDISVAGQTFYQFYLTDLRNSSRWVHFKERPTVTELIEFLDQVVETNTNSVVLISRYPFIRRYPEFCDWCDKHAKEIEFIDYDRVVHQSKSNALQITTIEQKTKSSNGKVSSGDNMPLTHLQRLEAESIQIMREVVAETENPVMLYSIGKDSAVMLHIAMKAFYPSLPPFPLLHVDTQWKFQDMYAFRDKLIKDLGLKLITHVNPEGVEKGINPFTHGSAIHTDIMKTEGLKQALNQYGFDAAFGGARRDEEKSRAKERIFSFRSADHRWDPKNQRPELWKQYNAKKHKGESIRVFPISNWTELDIWQYIHLEGIPIVPLYYSAERPVVERDGSLIMVDDDRMPLNEGEIPMMKHVRFRTLGCYPLTGAVESKATTLPEIIQEMLLTKTSERQGRAIDHDSAASMEKKKQEGYF
ncbi:MAG: sulfate adenylyltransferase subunit 2 [Neptuniibacter pectenicola]|jgi:sulfate adenylyltransferase subunit 2